MTTNAVEISEARHFIGGEWAESESGRTYENKDPFTGEVVANVAAGTPVS